MQKRTRNPRHLMQNPGSRNWRTALNQDLRLYAQSFHAAAKQLAEAPEFDSGALADFAASPVVFIYRHALELHLKAVILGDGGNFLATKPDQLSIYKTHAVAWLAQFVSQIVTALQWEPEFKCPGVGNLDDFKAVIENIHSVDPGSYVFRLPVTGEAHGSVPRQATFNVREFATTMDALLELLDSTADALAAEWDMRSDATAMGADANGRGFEPTIQ
jgi:hypothetical protein